MQHIANISIPKPCTQNWNDMLPENSGRHCLNCSKTVVDFTVMSNEQIIATISNQEIHAAGLKTGN